MSKNRTADFVYTKTIQCQECPFRVNKAYQHKAPSEMSGWLRSWRYLLLLLLIFLGVIGFYLEENWRGQRALNRYTHDMASRKVILERDFFVPAPVPDSQNFANTPLLGPLFDFYPGTQQTVRTNAHSLANDIAPLFDSVKRQIGENRNEVLSNSWAKAHLDLIAWQEALRASEHQTNNPAKFRAKTTSSEKQTLVPHAGDQLSLETTKTNSQPREAALEILNSLSECNSLIEQLRTDSQRPFSRFNIRYGEKNPAGILLPHLAVLKHLTMILQLRVAAELAAGRGEEAFNDLKLMLHLTNATREEPILISHLVRMSQMQLAFAEISDGLRHWSIPQLEELQHLLTQFNFCADVKHTMEADRVLFGAGVIEFVRHSPKEFNSLISTLSAPLSVPEFFFAAVPGGWFDFEKVNYFRLLDSYLAPEVFNEHHVNPTRIRQIQQQVETELGGSSKALIFRHRLFARLLIPNFEGAIRKSAFAQQGCEEAAIACALERYRRSHQSYPERLDALVPQFIARLSPDIISGQPLKYKRTDSIHYLLYSVGWNEMDDSGQSISKKGQSITVRSEPTSVPLEGDWVWTE